jgi:hypothetical protein
MYGKIKSFIIPDLIALVCCALALDLYIYAHLALFTFEDSHLAAHGMLNALEYIYATLNGQDSEISSEPGVCPAPMYNLCRLNMHDT